MAEQGSIILNTGINTKGFKVGSKELEAAVRSAAESVSGLGNRAKIAIERSALAFSKQNGAIAEQRKKVADLAAELDRLKTVKTPTDEYNEITKQIEDAEKKLSTLVYRMEKFTELGGDKNSKTFMGMRYEADQLRETIDYAKGELQDLVETGGAYKGVDTSGAANKLAAEQGKLATMEERATLSLRAFNNQLDQSSAKAEKAKKKHNEFGKGLAGGIKKLAKFGMMALGIGSLVAIFGKLRSAVTDSLKSIVQVDSQTNQTMSEFKSSLAQLKNSFGALIAPIANVLLPLISRMTQAISGMVNKLAQITAAALGQKSAIQAKYAYDDYAESVKGAAKAQSYLTGLDEVQKQSSSDSGGGSGPSPADMFETVPIESKFQELGDKIRAAFEGLASWFQTRFGPLLEPVKNLFTAIGNLALWLWNNVLWPFIQWCDENILAPIITWVAAIIDAVTRVVNGVTEVLEGFRTGDWSLVWQGIKDIFGGAWDAIVATLQAAFQILWNILVGVWNLIKPGVEAAWNWIKGIFNTVKSKVTEWVTNIKTSIVNTFNNVKTNVTNTFTNMKTAIVNAFTNIKNAIKTPINAILGFINRMISGVVGGINSVINGLNKLQINVPSWVQSMFGISSFGFNIAQVPTPQIPLLAQGAVIPPNRAFTAVLGDQKHGQNLEAPEDLIRQIVREESGGGATYNITAMANRKVLFDLIIDEGKARQVQSGRNPFEFA